MQYDCIASDRTPQACDNSFWSIPTLFLSTALTVTPLVVHLRYPKLDGAELTPDGAYEDGVGGAELSVRVDLLRKLSESAMLEARRLRPDLTLDATLEMLEPRDRVLGVVKPEYPVCTVVAVPVGVTSL